MDQQEPKHASPWIAWSLVMLFAGIAGFSIWYYYDQVSTVYDTTYPTFFGAKVHKTSTPSTTTTTPSTTTTSSAFQVKELGFQFTLPTELVGLNYVITPNDTFNLDFAGFSTKNLVTLGGNSCAAGSTGLPGPIGEITLTTTAPLPASQQTVENTPGTFIKQVGSKYLFFKSPQATCSDNTSAQKAEIDGIAALQKALQTATVIK